MNHARQPKQVADRVSKMKIFYNPKRNQLVGWKDDLLYYVLVEFDSRDSIRGLSRYSPKALGWIEIGDL